MTGFLLDTNVVSAFAPGRPAPPAPLRHWLEERSDALYLSAVSVAEIGAGIRKLRRGGAERRADALGAWFGELIALYGDRVLPFDAAAAEVAGELIDTARAKGVAPGFADIVIAATARVRSLVLLSANLRHFAPLAIAVVDPFTQRPA